MILKKQHKWMIGLAILFLLVNIILLYADKDQKVAQTTHVKTWTKVTEQDMYESLYTKGVLDYSEENFLYFDESKGAFQEFLVEEGQEISAGEELYSYEIENYYETASQLESESNKINDEISAVERAISQMSSYQIAATAPPQAPVDQAEEGEGSAELAQYMQMMSESQNNEQAELLKEQYLTEKEKELAQKQAEAASVESQLTELTTEGDTITVESPYDGVVTGLSETLADPLVTLKSDELIVRGELTEKEHASVEPEFDVNITMKENNEIEEGIVKNVATFPKNISIVGKSKYPFTVDFVAEDEDVDYEDLEIEEDEDGTPADEQAVEDSDGEEEEKEKEGGYEEENDSDLSENPKGESEEIDPSFIPGYHADIEVITDESTEAAVVNDRLLHGLSIWQMTTKGTLVKVPVETGIKMDNMVEIEKGVEKNDWIARQPEERFSTNTPFITSLDLTSVNAKQLKSGRWFQDLMIGLLSR